MFSTLQGALDSDAFSVASISAFVAAFGFATAGTLDVTGSHLAAIPVGVVVGLVFAWFTIWLTRRIRGLRTSGTHSVASLVGHEARVLTAIPEGGHGEVTLHVGGQLVKYSARAEQPIEAGTRVWVSRVLSATALEVRPTDALEASPELHD